MNKVSYSIVAFALVAVIGIIFFTGGSESKQNVEIKDGIQYISIDAKGGYTPSTTLAQADLPTVVKVNTKGTFDCSSALVIPDLGYRNNLPSSGETVIDVPPQKTGTKIQGLCAMGMYNFSINFN